MGLNLSITNYMNRFGSLGSVHARNPGAMDDFGNQISDFETSYSVRYVPAEKSSIRKLLGRAVVHEAQMTVIVNASGQTYTPKPSDRFTLADGANLRITRVDQFSKDGTALVWEVELDD